MAHVGKKGHKVRSVTLVMPALPVPKAPPVLVVPKVPPAIPAQPVKRAIAVMLA